MIVRRLLPELASLVEEILFAPAHDSLRTCLVLIGEFYEINTSGQIELYDLSNLHYEYALCYRDLLII